MEDRREEKLIRQRMDQGKLEDVPFDGDYDVVVTDPPWPIVVYGRKGKPEGFVDTKHFSTCFKGQVREHSRKPDEFYATIARVLDGRKVDLFARQPRHGFDVIGNQADKFSIPNAPLNWWE